MAKQTKKTERPSNSPPHRITSIGKSNNSRPKNKHARHNNKKYRGQGR